MGRSRVQGAARLKRTLKRIEPEITVGVREALHDAAAAVLADAQAAAPVRSGFLKSRLRAVVSKDGLSARVGSFGGRRQRAPHAFLVEFGTAAGQRKTAAGTMAWHPGTPPQPFLMPAYMKHKKKNFASIKEATIAALNKASRS